MIFGPFFFQNWGSTDKRSQLDGWKLSSTSVPMEARRVHKYHSVLNASSNYDHQTVKWEIIYDFCRYAITDGALCSELLHSQHKYQRSHSGTSCSPCSNLNVFRINVTKLWRRKNIDFHVECCANSPPSLKWNSKSDSDLSERRRPIDLDQSSLRDLKSTGDLRGCDKTKQLFQFLWSCKSYVLVWRHELWLTETIFSTGKDGRKRSSERIK